MGTATAPNPRLSPDVFDKTTVRFQYMFEPAGKLSIQYGYQTWPGKLYEVAECLTEEDFNKLKQSYDAELIDGFLASGYRVFTYEDSAATSRKLQTIEIDYSQNIPFIRGLNITANFSRAIPNWIKTGTAPKKATAGIKYSYRQFRCSVFSVWTDRTWRSVTSDETRPYNSRKRYAQFDMNVDLYYKITNAFQLYLSVNNLLNSPVETYVATRPDILLESDLPGTTIRFGIKGNF
jgi:outer membrane receptor protein involved in Fe transport